MPDRVLPLESPGPLCLAGGLDYNYAAPVLRCLLQRNIVFGGQSHLFGSVSLYTIQISSFRKYSCI